MNEDPNEGFSSDFDNVVRRVGFEDKARENEEEERREREKIAAEESTTLNLGAFPRDRTPDIDLHVDTAVALKIKRVQVSSASS